MLVLSRRRGEDIVIGEGPDAVIVRVVDVDRGKVRLGVIAPRHVKVDRTERRERDEGRAEDGFDTTGIPK